MKVAFKYITNIAKPGEQPFFTVVIELHTKNNVSVLAELRGTYSREELEKLFELSAEVLGCKHFKNNSK